MTPLPVDLPNDASDQVATSATDTAYPGAHVVVAVVTGTRLHPTTSGYVPLAFDEESVAPAS